MKKMILFGLVCFSVLMQSFSANATIVNVSITYEKGTKEWNADKTATLCVGKGLCEVKVDIGVNHIGPNNSGTLGLNDRGQLVLTFNSNIVKDNYWAETFANGQLFIGKDITLGSDIRSSIKNCPTVIKAGSYKFTIENSTLIVII